MPFDHLPGGADTVPVFVVGQGDCVFPPYKAFERIMETGNKSHRYRAHGIPVVTLLQGEKPAFPFLPPVMKVLHRHFQGRVNRAGAIAGEHHMPLRRGHGTA